MHKPLSASAIPWPITVTIDLVELTHAMSTSYRGGIEVTGKHSDWTLGRDMVGAMSETTGSGLVLEAHHHLQNMSSYANVCFSFACRGLGPHGDRQRLQTVDISPPLVWSLSISFKAIEIV